MVETNLLVDLNESCRGADVELSSEVEGVAVTVLVGDIFGRRASSRGSLVVQKRNAAGLLGCSRRSRR